MSASVTPQYLLEGAVYALEQCGLLIGDANLLTEAAPMRPLSAWPHSRERNKGDGGFCSISVAKSLGANP